MRLFVRLMFASCCFLPSAGAQKAELQAAPPLTMPILVDSNSPAYWNDGQLVLINSFGTPFSTTSSDQFALIEGSTGLVVVDRADNIPMWIESVFRDADGSLYAWYHHEPGGVCPSSGLTAPKIGALVSRDGGRTFTDLGIVLSSGDAVDCSAKNGFFAGGHGDFSVIYDADHGNFYFLFGNYGGSSARQGVSIARMSYADRDNPVGNIWKYSDGGWNEPGIGGQMTPILPATVAWQESNADSFWGPSVHWNSYLKSYVILLNRACCAPKWPQEGIYISFNTDLDNPGGWSKPERILSASDIGFSPGYYPQVLGLGWEETDTLAGEVARLYVKGFSKWEITFSHTPPAPDAP